MPAEPSHREQRRHVVLHVGPMKTGSTSIQAWLARHRDALLAAGIFVPASLGPSHSALMKIVARARQPRAVRSLADLTAELGAIPAAARQIVFSGEMLGQVLRSAGQIAGLKRLLDPYAASYRVVNALRRQDLQSVSLFSTRLRRGVDAQLLGTPFPYDSVLAAWAEVFGRDQVTPRIFERESLLDGDAVADFIAAAGLSAPGLPPPGVRTKNASLHAPAQDLLRRVSDALEAEGVAMPGLMAKNMPYWNMRLVLQQRFPGAGLLPSRAEALEFYERCRAGNEHIRQIWFPERPTLFNEDFSRYPETAAPPPSDAEILDVAIAVIGRLLQPAPDEAPQRKRGKRK